MLCHVCYYCWGDLTKTDNLNQNMRVSMSMTRPDGLALLTEVWEILDFVILTRLLKRFCQKKTSLGDHASHRTSHSHRSPHWGITPVTGPPTATWTQEIFCNGVFEEVIEGS